MKRTELNRRDFNRLTSATLGGLLAGTIAGCGGGDEPAGGGAAGGNAGGGGTEPAGGGTELAENPLLSEPHVCRGLNTCKGEGKSGDNECAGQGACATAAEHTCHTQNECKGQGGCGEMAGQNACKGMGECAVPLKEETWEKARAKFKELMETAGNTVGEPPAA